MHNDRISLATDAADIPSGVTTKKTSCRYCLAFCGIEVTTDGEKVYDIKPDREHLFSWQDFCQKGATAESFRANSKRITKPMKRVGNDYVETSYEEAIADIGRRLRTIRDRHGPNAIAGYLGNPGSANSTASLFHNLFMKSIGSANSFYVGSIDQNSAHVVANRMYGSEMAILVPDIDNADCIMLIGTNPAVSKMAWLETNRNGWSRVLERKQQGLDLIVVDPRVTPTTKEATTHVSIRPGTDWALLLAIIKVVFLNGWHNPADCKDAAETDVLRMMANNASLEDLAVRCQVAEREIVDIARRFATAKTGFCVTRTGVSMTQYGTVGEWLAQALNVICGRVDREGGRYYQPGVFKNSMEVVNTLGKGTERRSRIGGFQAIAGAYPVGVLADEITTPGRDQVRALIVCAGNPVVSGPQGDKLDTAFQQLDLLVAIDLYQRESHRHADWIIPGRHYLEREDFFATYGMIFEKPFAQIHPQVVNPPDQIKDDWEFYVDLILEMGRPLAGIPGMNTVVRISRWLSTKTGNSRHAFNPRWIWALLINLKGVVKWKDIACKPEGLYCRDFEIGEFRSLLQTHDGKIHLAPSEFVEMLRTALEETVDEDARYPFLLVNQRRTTMMNSYLDQFVPQQYVHGDFVEMNPHDAERIGILDWQEVIISSSVSSLNVLARLTDEVPHGVVSMDHGWGSRLYDPKGGEAPVVLGQCKNRLVPAAELDSIAGTPNFNSTAVGICARSR